MGLFCAVLLRNQRETWSSTLQLLVSWAKYRKCRSWDRMTKPIVHKGRCGESSDRAVPESGLSQGQDPCTRRSQRDVGEGVGLFHDTSAT